MPAVEGLILLGLSLAAANVLSAPPPRGLPVAVPDTQEVPLPSGFSYPQLRRYLAALRPRADTAALADASEPPLQIAGLIIDETVTKVGQDFYAVFRGAWTPPEGFRNHTIRIQEQPVPGLGTRVVLMLDGEPLLQLQLQPRYDYVEEVARQAAAYTAAEVGRRSPRAGREAAGGSGGGEGR